MTTTFMAKIDTTVTIMPAKQRYFLRPRPVLFGLLLGLSPALAWPSPVTFHTTAGGSGSAVLEIAAEELVTMTAYPFQLTIRDANGRPLTRAQVNCALTMPSMFMPENRPAVTECNGVYVGEVIFTCPMGDWRFTCRAETPAGASQTVTFEIPRVRMK